ncbi:hypothetical protein G2W53_044904 [Senna tora]|uniref:Uncharacterized protein n=1 Tax=Senna tora TaxID=362788 RepID=A0A834SCR3_9FABA|nr:hypothetical protein G2W53_044904 [Senna tora]
MEGQSEPTTPTTLKNHQWNAIEDALWCKSWWISCLKEKLWIITSSGHTPNSIPSKNIEIKLGGRSPMVVGANASGFGWDADRKCVTAEPAVWMSM